MYKQLNTIQFPKFQGIMVNMMPIIVGDENSLPDYLKPYQSLINECSLEKGSLAYLTVRESHIRELATQSRGGIHVEAPKMKAWGGGSWGGMALDKGVYMASTDGACRVWNEICEDRDEHGACSPTTEGQIMIPSTLYWMTDKTPHEALPSQPNTNRQFFRLVSDEISVWFAQHNTPNPKGIMPNCEISHINKFMI